MAHRCNTDGAVTARAERQRWLFEPIQAAALLGLALLSLAVAPPAVLREGAAQQRHRDAQAPVIERPAATLLIGRAACET